MEVYTIGWYGRGFLVKDCVLCRCERSGFTAVVEEEGGEGEGGEGDGFGEDFEVDGGADGVVDEEAVDAVDAGLEKQKVRSTSLCSRFHVWLSWGSSSR